MLACGLAVTVLSNLPSLRLFGWVSALAIVAALVADLLILRPTIVFLREVAARIAGAAASAGPGRMSEHRRSCKRRYVRTC